MRGECSKRVCHMQIFPLPPKSSFVKHNRCFQNACSTPQILSSNNIFLKEMSRIIISSSSYRWRGSNNGGEHRSWFNKTYEKKFTPLVKFISLISLKGVRRLPACFLECKKKKEEENHEYVEDVAVGGTNFSHEGEPEKKNDEIMEEIWRWKIQNGPPSAKKLKFAGKQFWSSQILSPTCKD